MALSFDLDINPMVTFLLNDTEVRWSKANRIFWLNDGVKQIRYMRGDSTLDEWDDVEYSAYVDGSGNDVILADIFLHSIVNYIVWKCYDQDSQDEFNMQLSQRWEQNFRTEVNK